jgi:hypothetical protein
MNTAKNETSTFPMWKSLFVYMLVVVVFMYENAVRINRVFHVSLRIQRQAAVIHNALSSIGFSQHQHDESGSFCNGVRFFACVLATKSIMHFLSLSKPFLYFEHKFSLRRSTIFRSFRGKNCSKLQHDTHNFFVFLSLAATWCVENLAMENRLYVVR